MTERGEGNQSKSRIEAVAVRFSTEDTPRGWEKLDEQGLPLAVVGSGEGLVYLFSSVHWDTVQNKLEEAGIVCQFKQAAGFTKEEINNPETWNSTVPNQGE